MHNFGYHLKDSQMYKPVSNHEPQAKQDDHLTIFSVNSK